MPFTRALLLVLGYIVLVSALLSADENTFKYSYMPKKVYENQVFPVTIICVNACENSRPEFTFDTLSDIAPLQDEPTVIKNGKDSFYTFYFKASKIDVRVPRLFVNNAGQKVSLPSHTVMLGQLPFREDFCSVLAADMRIENSQVSNYDEANHLVTLTIEAYEANLEDMTLNNVLESGIEHLKREKSKVVSEFYFVIPASQKNIKFTYFNTIKNQYVYLQTPVNFVNTTLVTQTDLNPSEDSFELLKKYSLMLLGGFFFLMFLFKRDFFYLVLAVISLITLLTLYIPHKKICIKQGAPLYILPTETSTMSIKLDSEVNTVLLGEHENYKKVEIKKGMIGWVKNEDICEN